MAILKNLLNRAKRATGVGEKPRPVIRTVNSPKDRKSRIDPEPVPQMPNDPSMPDYNADALSLQGEPVPDDDPYGKQSWDSDPEADTRRLKQLAIDPKTGELESDNPYESADSRPGWKE